MGTRTLIAAAVVLLPTAATAQTFTFEKPPDDVKPEVTWTATAEAGLLVTTGNSDTRTLSAAAKATRTDPKNKLDASFGIAYARSTILVAADANGDNLIGPDEIDEQSTTTANSWLGRVRYDRFLTSHDSLYATGSIGADPPAGKDLFGGGQVGYSRGLYVSEKHTVVSEAGYDFTYEDLAAGEALSIHSARVFLGYKGTLRTDTAAELSVEALSNLNTLQTVPEESDAFEDTRVNGVAAITTKLTDDISFAFSFTAKYDAVPAPRPAFAGFAYEPGFVPLADELDTITKATLIVSLL